MRLLRKRPEVILIPDDHAEWKDLRQQAEALKKHKPDILLHEALCGKENRNPEEFEDLVQKMARFETNVAKVHQKIGMEFLGVRKLGDLKGKLPDDKELDRTLRKTKTLIEHITAEKRNLERMMQGGQKRSEWAKKKYEERAELLSQLLEIQEVLTRIKDPTTSGLAKAAWLVALARKNGIPVEGLEDETAVQQHLKALRANNGINALRAIRQRDKGMIETVMKHASKGKKVMVVTGAMHAANIYAKLQEKKIPVRIIDTGLIPENAREDLRKRARGEVYSETVLNMLRERTQRGERRGPRP